jgi:hypothetical protein
MKLFLVGSTVRESRSPLYRPAEQAGDLRLPTFTSAPAAEDDLEAERPGANDDG